LIRYLDTSVLVSALVQEVHSGRAQSWLGGQKSDELAISDWVISEFSSALSLKIRMKIISEEDRAASMAGFARLTKDFLTILPISSGHFRLAARFADRHELQLRAGDALHLAVAAQAGFSLCTFDRKLAAAGPPLGVSTYLL
jgi:predicted nucleic acid-binding protein